MSIPAPARQCGTCALCCKLGEIPDFKPFNQWCQFCSTRQGCDIYADRPQLCRDFFCHYLQSDLPEHWNPLTCHMIVSVYEGPLRMTVSVDPDYPLIWREPLYLEQIQHWAAQGAVTVMVGTRTFAAYPGHVEDLGELTAAHQLIITEIETAQGLRYRSEIHPR